ncbi:MAG: TraM recognition domain-containing protein [Proteobacteria bacterium]|nr:TraM recognition domain-containing protein [Pseudomonadota bacterium]
MSATSKGRATVDAHTEAVALWSVIGLVVVGVGLLNAAVRLGAALDGRGERLPGNPVTLVADVVRGRVAWPEHATVVLIGLLVLLAALAGAAAWLWRRLRPGGGVDRAARHMGGGRDLAALDRRGAAATAKRLGVDRPGLTIAKTVIGGRVLYQGWEDTATDIAGPRTGKTTSRVIPAILEAPGAVVSTSNKRDVVDATRDPRSAEGPVWVFDPQQLVAEPVTWWWNPLRYVTDEEKAATLADVFAAAVADPDARTDAFFDPKGQKVVAALLLAAASAGRTIDQVYLWVADPRDDQPVILLREAGYDLLAASLAAEINAPDKQRGGVYGTAEKVLAFLTNGRALAWVTPGEGREEFRPEEFVQGTGTLYSLSKEGKGSLGALVAALTVAVTEAAEELAKGQPGGRLRVPALLVLDEAANVCRWPELPNLYSHYGSRGICVMTFLQSWSQGVEVWGRNGMRKLWSASTVKVYGGGVSEVEFLSDLAQLIGDYERPTTSSSHAKGGRSTTYATQRERILDVSDLAALPRGRAIVLAAGAPPVLVRTLPWMAGPRAAEVRLSLREHDPAAPVTLAAAAAALGEDEAAGAGASTAGRGDR